MCAAALCVSPAAFALPDRFHERADVDTNIFPYNAIKQFKIEDEDTCTMQFGHSAQVATTAAHCFDLAIVTSLNFPMPLTQTFINAYDEIATQEPSSDEKPDQIHVHHFKM